MFRSINVNHNELVCWSIVLGQMSFRKVETRLLSHRQIQDLPFVLNLDSIEPIAILLTPRFGRGELWLLQGSSQHRQNVKVIVLSFWGNGFSKTSSKGEFQVKRNSQSFERMTMPNRFQISSLGLMNLDEFRWIWYPVFAAGVVLHNARGIHAYSFHTSHTLWHVNMFLSLIITSNVIYVNYVPFYPFHPSCYCLAVGWSSKCKGLERFCIRVIFLHSGLWFSLG